MAFTWEPPESRESFERSERERPLAAAAEDKRRRNEDCLLPWLTPGEADRRGREWAAREARRRRTIAEAPPATASRKLGCSGPIAGAEYNERATLLRLSGREALHQLDIDEFNAGVFNAGVNR